MRLTGRGTTKAQANLGQMRRVRLKLRLKDLVRP